MCVVVSDDQIFKNDYDDTLHTTELRKQSEPVENGARVFMHDVSDKEVNSEQYMSVFFFEVRLAMVETDNRGRQLFLRGPSRVDLDGWKSEFQNLVEVSIVLSDHSMHLEVAVLVSILV